MNVLVALGELKWVILCVALFLIESALKWLRQRNYQFLDATRSAQWPRIEKREGGRRERGRRETGTGRVRDDGDGGGEEMTETNASALTAVLHFLTDRHTNEDHKSNESLQD